MPYKKKAGKGKEMAVERVESPGEFVRFQSDGARGRFHKFTVKRNLWPERGFVYQSGNTLGYPDFIHSVIFKHKWVHFCEQPSAAIIPLVKEFYANFNSESPGSVFVRGKQIDISGKSINRIFKLANVSDTYSEFSESLDDDQLNEILEELCREGAKWSKSAQGSMTIPRCSLKQGPMIWNLFLKSRLMPSTHDHTVQKERAILLYSIVEGH